MDDSNRTLYLAVVKQAICDACEPPPGITGGAQSQVEKDIVHETYIRQAKAWFNPISEDFRETCENAGLHYHNVYTSAQEIIRYHSERGEYPEYFRRVVRADLVCRSYSGDSGPEDAPSFGGGHEEVRAHDGAGQTGFLDVVPGDY